jgi:predicted NAD/FAD-dependent oxidoreductase
MLGFEHPIPVPFDAAFVRDSALSWVARNNSKPGRGDGEAWVLHASPEWSHEHLEDEPDEVRAALTDAFFDALAAPPSTPTQTSTHRWRYALPAEPLPQGCLWDEEQRIGVCGDWCHGPRIESAFLSGLALAERILRTDAQR